MAKERSLPEFAERPNATGIVTEIEEAKRQLSVKFGDEDPRWVEFDSVQVQAPKEASSQEGPPESSSAQGRYVWTQAGIDIMMAKGIYAEWGSPAVGSMVAKSVYDMAVQHGVWDPYVSSGFVRSEDQARDDAPEDDGATRLFLEPNPHGVAGNVLVHRVPPAPPRPILCTDDPEASILKAVQLLLAYPELDALPIVSPLRCTVVAHLTLSYCLTYLLSRLRGSDLQPLAQVAVTAKLESGAPAPAMREYNNDSKPSSGGERWAEPRQGTGQRPPPEPWVLARSQPLGDLLAFFARTHYSGAPIVESAENGGVIGYISRRNLLQFLDLAMQSKTRAAIVGDGADSTDQEEIVFDISAPVEVVLETLRRYRAATEDALASNPNTATSNATSAPHAEDRPLGADKGNNAYNGALFVYDKAMPLKTVLLRLLSAENRKILFVQDGNEEPPRLLRILSVSDVWLELIGTTDILEAAKAADAPAA